ncbi:MAG TPA: hypothetical protein VFL91_21270 [Thermomicrobiales bacterium]|nr:hypothetical protein [Thermomicrobiales bacterium]
MNAEHEIHADILTIDGGRSRMRLAAIEDAVEQITGWREQCPCCKEYYEDPETGEYQERHRVNCIIALILGLQDHLVGRPINPWVTTDRFGRYEQFVIGSHADGGERVVWRPEIRR